jgi:hypothetical protein
MTRTTPQARGLMRVLLSVLRAACVVLVWQGCLQRLFVHAYKGTRVGSGLMMHYEFRGQRNRQNASAPVDVSQVGVAGGNGFDFGALNLETSMKGSQGPRVEFNADTTGIYIRPELRGRPNKRRVWSSQNVSNMWDGLDMFDGDG